MIASVSDEDNSNVITHNENKVALSFSPIYHALYKVWESMAKDDIITEVKRSIYNTSLLIATSVNFSLLKGLCHG